MTRFLLLFGMLWLLPIASIAGTSCMKPTGAVLLQSKDAKRLQLARSLKAYLKENDFDERLSAAIYKASLKTGVDFELMVLNAKMESDLGRATIAEHTSARGVFQYIEPTWLTLMRRYGDELGYGHYAKAIKRAKYPGLPYIEGNNPYLKAEILALRHDIDTAAMIKAYQVREESDTIKSIKHGRVTATDHYIVHMLGLPLAKRFYKMRASMSTTPVANSSIPAMREAAHMNRAFFYSGKRALTAREVYAKYEARVGKEFRSIHNAAFNTAADDCIEKEEEKPLLHLASLTPLCSGFRADLQQPPSLHATLYQLHPCARVRSH